MFSWTVEIIHEGGLLAIALMMAVETVVPIVPSEVIMPLAGYDAGHHLGRLAGVIAAGTAGSVIGGAVWYLLGRWFGLERLKRWAERHERWTILTPVPGSDPAAVARLKAFWQGLGSQVDVMDSTHHDLVLAITSHLPHLIAYNIVGTAHDLERVTEGEVIKYSASGFRDFTRIAASDPTMWRDIFLNNRDAVLEVLGRFNEDLAQLQRAVRNGDGQTLFDWFTRTRAIRRAIVDIGQDTAAPDFGRSKT